MKSFVRVFSACGLLSMVFLLGGGAVRAMSADADYDSLRRFSQVLDMVDQYYVKEVSQKELMDGALKGMLQNLDPHSDLLSVEDYATMQESSSGEFFGIGIEITTENGQLTVLSPIDDTPAQKAGMRSGDIIISIDGEMAQEMSLSEAARRMRGPKGTTVDLLVLHKNDQQPVNIAITRDAIPNNSVKLRKLEAGIYWLRVSRFSERTGLEMQSAIKQMNADGEVKGVVLDMRNNPGGIFDAGVKVADAFLKDGVIVSMRGRDRIGEQVFKATSSSDDITAPLVVLVNAGSASASEIVAGALLDQKRGLLVGERTFGKGSVQNIIPLPDGTALKITVALYYTPNGISIQAEGIAPDFYVPWEQPREAAEDPGFMFRESSLSRHLSQDGTQTDPTQSKNKNQKTPEEEEVANYLTRDNQLRMALQLVKTLPVARSLQ